MRGFGNLAKRSALALTGAALLLAMASAHAQGAYPGSNGKIAFSRDGQIWTMNPDGTNQTQITTVSPSYDPQWSPNGTRIAYSRGFGSNAETRIMNADGSNDVPGPGSHSLTWSPNGKRLAFIQHVFDENCQCSLHKLVDANPDGTQPQLRYLVADDDSPGLSDASWSPRGNFISLSLIEGDLNLWKVAVLGNSPSPVAADAFPDEFRAAWSPAGDRIAYLDGAFNDWSVTTINPDGTGRSVIAPHAYGVEWSPDGSKLVVSSRDASCGGCIELQVMNPDGSGSTTITNTAAEEADPDWQPVLSSPPPGYARPRGATPMRVSLVPAFEQCSSPNRTHGPPLAFGSCNPPVPSSTDRTIGSPDFNGVAANMVGSVRLETIVGNPSTAADEADVALNFSLTDIRCRPGLGNPPCGNFNSAAGRDWVGTVSGRIGARLTDRYALPAPGGVGPGTMTDQQITFDATCANTADTQIGGTCSLSTTLDALIPGMVIEGDRAVLELGQVEIRDQSTSGPVLLRQGVFIP